MKGGKMMPKEDPEDSKDAADASLKDKKGAPPKKGGKPEVVQEE